VDCAVACDGGAVSDEPFEDITDPSKIILHPSILSNLLANLLANLVAGAGRA